MTCDKYRLLLHELLDGQLPRRIAFEMAEHEATCPVCLAYREEMYELLQNLHTLDADIEPPDELSIAWRQMIRMEKPAKPRIATTVKVWVAMAALLVLLFGGTTLVHVGLLPGRASNPRTDESVITPGIGNILTEAQTGSALMPGDSSILQSGGGEQKILRSGSYTVKTNRFDEDKDAILDLVLQYGGYAQHQGVSGDPLNQDGKGGRFCTLQIRVPETTLNGFIRSLSSLIDVVDFELIAQDYTDQYAEQTTRLAALRNQLARFTQLRSETQNIDEILTIEARIADIEAQISATQAILQNWDSREIFSQIDIGLQESAESLGINGMGLWDRMRTQFNRSARAVGSYFVDMAVFMMMAAPWILVVVALAGAALLVEKLNWRSRQM
ncbi:hypothetical protein AGMMS49992_04390 [Clostridia bacterium]|nr:hypothetical protein AGMMS49992_04390 [Clostridia bacterium]